MPEFIPVDHDPFASSSDAPSAGAAPQFIPVDHDPFAEAAPKKPFSWTDAFAETWPARVAKSIYSGVTLPHDVATGEARLPGENVPGSVPFGDPQSSGERVADLAFLTNPSAIPRVPGAAQPAVEALQSAEAIGTRLPRSIASPNVSTKFTAQMLAKGPTGAPIQEGIKTAIGETADAVGRAAEMAGGSVNPATTGGAFRKGVETTFEANNKKILDQAYGKVSELVDPAVKTPLSATQAVIEDITARRLASGEKDPGKAVKAVHDAVYKQGEPETRTILQGPGYHIADEVPTREGLTFNGLKDRRTRVGYMLRGQLPEGLDRGELNQLYTALTQDLETSARNAGGQPAVDALGRASLVAKKLADRETSIEKTLGSDTKSNEGIAGNILQFAGKTNSADIKALARARSAVSPAAWQNVASTAIDRLGKNAAGEWSPAKFIKDYDSLSVRGKSLLFRSVGKEDLLPYLDHIAKVSQRFVDAGKLGNPPGSGAHTAAWMAAGSVGTGLVSGRWEEPAMVIGGLIGTNLMARVLNTKATVASYARWTRAYDALVHSPRPTPNAIAVFNMTSRNFANTVNGEFGTKIDPNDLTKAIQGQGGGNTGIPQ